MMQCVRRCSFICGAVLSILLLLCSCQAGAGPLILPDNVPSKNTSQGKEKLLAALNTVDIRRPETTQDSYIQVPTLSPRRSSCASRRNLATMQPLPSSYCLRAGIPGLQIVRCSLEQAFAFSR